MPISGAGAAPANLCMLRFGHTICISFHVTALYFGAAYLLLTIPVHLIYAAVAFAKEDGAARRPNTGVLCTECNELVLTDSNICEQCRGNSLAHA
jgi:hypothetical protein